MEPIQLSEVEPKPLSSRQQLAEEVPARGSVGGLSADQPTQD